MDWVKGDKNGAKHKKEEDVDWSWIRLMMDIATCHRGQYRFALSILMIILLWNYRGACKTTTLDYLRVLNRKFHPDI